MGIPELDSVWQDTYRYALYPVWMEEESSKWMFNFWSRVNVLSSILVTVTATTSTIAGWSLWNEEKFRIVWAIIAGAASIASILTSSFEVPTRVRKHSEYRTGFLRLRLSIEAFLQDLYSMDSATARERFKKLRDEGNDLVAKAPTDFMLTQSRSRKIQAGLDKLLVAKGYVYENPE